MFAIENLTWGEINLRDPYVWKQGTNRLCFLFIKNGEGCYEAGAATQALKPDDLIVFNTLVPGRLRPLNGGDFAVSHFLIDYEQLLPLFTLREVCLLKTVANRLRCARLYPSTGDLAQRCHALVRAAPTQNTIEQRCHLLKIAAAALAEEINLAQGRCLHPSGITSQCAELLGRLSLKQIETLSVAELARQLGYSRRHLSRLFHEHMGTSVVALKMEIRLIRALYLLQDPAAKVVDVAMSCGFNHLGLFSSSFKRRFGLTPSKWRQRESSGDPLTLQSSLSDHACSIRASGLCVWSSCSKPEKAPVPVPVCRIPQDRVFITKDVPAHVSV